MNFSSIKDTFGHVSKKQKVSSSKSEEVIYRVGQEIEQALEKLRLLPDTATVVDCKSIVTELHKRLNDLGTLNQLESSQKELNSGFSKYAKLVEKSFNPDISKAYRNVAFDTHTINQIIACYLYRQGLFDLGDCFMNETREPEATSFRSSFLEMYQILEAMRSRNLEPALNWVTTHQDRLKLIGSSIELKLHRLQFLEILQKKEQRDTAFKYLKTYLSPLGPRHMAEIQKLMACLLWAGRLDCSPYAEFLSSTRWVELAEELTQQFCNLLGQSYGSPLKLVIEAGVEGLPTLLKLVNVMSAKKQDWQEMKQLPVPVGLRKEFQFHSIFVCPVLRDQAGEENPPMLLPCGHVLCKQSILKLSKNSTRMFKCPYCPFVATAVDCRQIYI